MHFPILVWVALAICPPRPVEHSRTMGARAECAQVFRYKGNRKAFQREWNDWMGFQWPATATWPGLFLFFFISFDNWFLSRCKDISNKYNKKLLKCITYQNFKLPLLLFSLSPRIEHPTIRVRSVTLSNMCSCFLYRHDVYCLCLSKSASDVFSNVPFCLFSVWSGAPVQPDHGGPSQRGQRHREGLPVSGGEPVYTQVLHHMVTDCAYAYAVTPSVLALANTAHSHERVYCFLCPCIAPTETGQRSDQREKTNWVNWVVTELWADCILPSATYGLCMPSDFRIVAERTSDEFSVGAGRWGGRLDFLWSVSKSAECPFHAPHSGCD